MVHDVIGWGLVVLGATVWGLAAKLLASRKSGMRLYAPSLWMWWSCLFLGVAGGTEGSSQLGARHAGWWFTAFVCLVAIAFQLAPLILSGKKSGTPTDPLSAPAPRPDTPGPPSEPDDETADLIQRIKTVQFSTIRLKPGYDEEEVDTFLDKLIAVLGEGGRLDQRELSTVQFATTRLRPGYVMQDVDGFLKDVARRAW